MRASQSINFGDLVVEVAARCILLKHTVKLNGPNNSGTVQSARQNGSLLVKVDGDKGSRTTKYTLSNDKTTLTMDVSLSNPNLPQPIQFQMTYVRAAAAANARGATGAAGR